MPTKLTAETLAKGLRLQGLQRESELGALLLAKEAVNREHF